MLAIQDVLDILAVDLIGAVPDDESVVTSSNKGEPLTFSNGSLATKAFLNIAKRICGNEVPFMDLSGNQKGFFSSLRRIFGN